MTNEVTPEKAITWLEGQLQGLGTIRNASTRDPGFRVWRQETLAFLQQIWPDRPGRWSRFRRVPFAPSSSRADEAETRETFERGFAEMRRLLKMWIAEINHKGLVHVDDPDELAEEPPKARRDEPPKVRKGAVAKQKEPLKQMLDLGKFDQEPELDQEAPAPTATAPIATEPPATMPIVTGAAALSPMVTEPTATGPAALAPIGTEPTATGPAALAPIGTESPATGATAKTPDAAPGQNFLEQTISDALVQAHERRPSNGSRKSNKTAGRSAKSPGGAAGIADLAKDLEALGIPASDREPLRAALTELAQRVDSGAITSAMLQAAVAVALVMRYPKLARRALPLFQSQLDKAA